MGQHTDNVVSAEKEPLYMKVSLNEEGKMRIELGNRTAETVAVYFKEANKEEIRKVLPQKARTLEEALADYEKTLRPDSTSYGRIILVDGQYVGDVWCYCMDIREEPNAMISYCIFKTDDWKKGIATEALRLFIAEMIEKFQFKTLGAFTFSSNIASIRVLEKNGFAVIEELEEDGVASKYLQYEA